MSGPRALDPESGSLAHRALAFGYTEFGTHLENQVPGLRARVPMQEMSRSRALPHFNALSYMHRSMFECGIVTAETSDTCRSSPSARSGCRRLQVVLP
ncbi:hypothetical protein EVAR_42801_1 [Eumeta japonica]|uniref:Uncharacterized protein n=1 Tax=Eumeta variegata TaxID=151549 RepID=A0A4C1WGZ8_EUMVA|nr:hypothetical protein EVAR_42801_1 [Eumeta japonica]